MANIGSFTADKTASPARFRALTFSVKVEAGAQRQGRQRRPGPPAGRQSRHGAAWNKTSEAGRGYKSVTLDDPSFPAPVYAYA